MRDTNSIYEEMVTQFLFVKDDPYGPRSLQMIMLTSYILIKKTTICIFVGKTVVPNGVHSVQGEAKKLFYKIIESLQYTIYTTKVIGRKEIVKNVTQVWFNLLFQNLRYLFKILHQKVVADRCSTNQYCCLISQKPVIVLHAFGENSSSSNFLKATFLCTVLPNSLLEQPRLSSATQEDRFRIVFRYLTVVLNI